MEAIYDTTLAGQARTAKRPQKATSVAADAVLVGWLVLISMQPADIVFAATALLALIGLVTRAPTAPRLFAFLWPFLLLTVAGALVGAASRTFEAWPFVRDLVYFTKAPLILLVAFGLAQWVGEFERILRAIFFASLFLAASYLAEYVIVGGWEFDRRSLQLTVGRAYYLMFFGLLVAILRPSAIAASVPSQATLACLGSVVMIAAAVASTSRGILLCPAFFLICLALHKMRVPFRPVLIASVAIVTFLSIPPFYATISGLIHVLDSPGINEVFTSDFGSEAQIHSAFRSYEAHLAWQQYLNLTTWQQLFGKGFGSLVELTMAVDLGVTAESKSTLTAVPITHISLLTALLKFGVFGAAIYTLSLLFLAVRRDECADGLAVLFNRTAVMLALFVVWAFQGYFSTLDIMNVALAIIGATQAMAAKRHHGAV